MANKCQRVMDSIKANYGTTALEDIVSVIGVIDEKATTLKQGKYVNELLNRFETMHGREATVKVMRPCGYECISESVIKTAKEIYRKEDSLEQFLILLNEVHIGGGNLHVEGNYIIGVYDKCYCGIAKQAKTMTSAYCECSAGWFEKLFSSVFEKEVQVRKISTILDGSDKCTFQISTDYF